MKVLAVLLSFTVFFLNAIPCCWDECAEDLAIEHAEQGGASQDACSPFLSCGSCTGFILEQELPRLSTTVLPTLKNSGNYSPGLSETDYSGTIWEPPKEA